MLFNYYKHILTLRSYIMHSYDMRITVPGERGCYTALICLSFVIYMCNFLKLLRLCTRHTFVKCLISVPQSSSWRKERME